MSNETIGDILAAKIDKNIDVRAQLAAEVKAVEILGAGHFQSEMEVQGYNVTHERAYAHARRATEFVLNKLASMPVEIPSVGVVKIKEVTPGAALQLLKSGVVLNVVKECLDGKVRSMAAAIEHEKRHAGVTFNTSESLEAEALSRSTPTHVVHKVVE